jgi:hypothetical protein
MKADSAWHPDFSTLIKQHEILFYMLHRRFISPCFGTIVPHHHAEPCTRRADPAQCL